MADLLPHKMICWNCDAIFESYGRSEEDNCHVTGEFICVGCLDTILVWEEENEAPQHEQPCYLCGHRHAD